MNALKRHLELPAFRFTSRLLMIFLGLGMVHATAADEKTIKALDDIADARSWCYQDARQVKATLQPQNKKYLEAQRRYEAVRSASDAWIDQARIRLIQGKGLSDPALTQTSQRIGAAEKDFRQFVSGLDAGRAEKTTTKPGFENLISLGPLLISLATSLFENYKKSDDAERDRLLQELERIRFAPFDKI